MFPAFTNAAMLAGLLAIAAPIIIHLLLRRRSQRMRFSTVQFFIKKDEQSMRKRKLRNLFLLSLRVLLFTLLVLAFARPYLPNSTAAATAARRQQAVLVMDNSASMQSAGTGDQQWKRARDAARQILSQLQADDRAALVLCSSVSSTASGFVPPSVLARKIEDLQPTFGSADLSDGLQEALKVLTTANPAHETSLHILSDLQRPGAQNLSSVPLPKELPVKIADLGDRFVPNVTVTDLRLQRENDSSPQAVITSFSDESCGGLAYRLRIDGKEVLSGRIALDAGAVTNLPLAIPALKAGWHSAEFSIQQDDSLAADNTRFATMLVPEPIRCLVIETRPAERTYLEEAFFVATALNPVTSGEVSPSRFTFEKATLDNFPAKLQPQPGQSGVRFVVLPGAKQLSGAVANTLKTFVQSGGGLLMFLGEGVSANNYNISFGDLLPVTLGRIDVSNDEPWHVGEVKTTSPAFALFRDAANGTLAIPEFTHRFTLENKADAIVTAQFEDGVPFAVERAFGQGRVVLVNTSADTRWTDWQKHKSFVAWLHPAASYLSGDNVAQVRDEMPTYPSGGEVDLPAAAKEQLVKLQREGGEESSLQADEDGILRGAALPVPGVYSLKDAAGTEIRRVAANIPSPESDLSFLSPAEVEQQIIRRNEPADTTLAAGLFGESPRGKELWRLLLLGALLFLVVEPFVANKTAA